MTSVAYARHRPFGPLADQFSDLLSRYPRLDRDRIEEMIAIYPKLSILEFGLLTADDELAAPFDAFMRDHRGRLNQSWKHHLFFVFVVLATFLPIAALVWMATN